VKVWGEKHTKNKMAKSVDGIVKGRYRSVASAMIRPIGDIGKLNEWKEEMLTHRAI
jgi:hypothetical protein